MGLKWDGFESLDQYREWVTDWAELLIKKALEPGAVCMFFGGTRTWHHLALGLEQGGFEVYDTIMWLHGQGFPKSHDVSKGLDKAAGAEREVIDQYERGLAMHPGHKGKDSWRENYTGIVDVTEPATDDARIWDGYGTALKPAWEPILLCRAPRGKHTFAELALEHGSGALNIDGARISHNEPEEIMEPREPQFGKTTYANARPSEEREGEELASPSPLGRWPANLILSHHEDCQKISEELKPSETLWPLGQATTGRPGEPSLGKDTPRKKLDRNRKQASTYRSKSRVINRFKSGMKPFGNAAGEKYETVKPTKARLPDGSVNPDYKRPDEESPWKMPPGKRRPTKTRVKSGKAIKHRSGGMNFDGKSEKALAEDMTYADEEGYELVDRWACVPECPVRQLDDQAGELISGNLSPGHKRGDGRLLDFGGGMIESEYGGDVGGPSRFFYTGKATRGEKDIGLDDFYWKRTEDGFERVTKAEYNKLPRRERAHANIHPTVKPLEILRYLATLVLPPKQEAITRRILVPFSGSGSEVIGAIQAGWDEALGIEMEPKYNEMAEARMRATLGMF